MTTSEASKALLPLVWLDLIGGGGGKSRHVDNKYRFRRKCDENTTLKILTRNDVVAGAGISVVYSGFTEVWIRVR